jgi:two-component system, OmpR family, phosphate regulon sensor histidine kinase PhoR
MKNSAFSQLDPRTLRMLQWVILVFSVVSVASLWLTQAQATPGYGYQTWAFYLVSGGLPLLGALQLLWLPITERKARWYIVGFTFFAVVAFMFVVGYVSIFIFIWLMLIMATDAFLGRQAALKSMGAFLGSMVLWWLIFGRAVPNGAPTLLLLFTLALFICAVALVVSQMRITSEQRGIALERSREEERMERERLVALVNSLGDAVIAMDDAGHVNLYNAAASSLLDTNVSLTGQPITSVLQLLDKKGQPVDVLSLLAAIKDQGNLVRSDLRHRLNDNELINIYLNISPVYPGFQQRADRGYILLLRDITKEKSLEQERDEFISVASHELRTPIAIAEGSLSNVIALKQQRADPAIVDQSIKAAHQQVMLLAKMTNDLATLSRAERGADIDVEPIDLHTLLARLRADYEPQAAKQNLTFLTRVNDPVEPLVSSHVYLQEILQNLITNALKYTKQGSVMVTASMDVHGVASFSVEDTGIGISKTDQHHLFTKFWRSEDYRTRESSGTGLGLYIVKRLAEQLGGQVSAESQLDHGTTFWVTIPPYAPREQTALPNSPVV